MRIGTTTTEFIQQLVKTGLNPDYLDVQVQLNFVLKVCTFKGQDSANFISASLLSTVFLRF